MSNEGRSHEKNCYLGCVITDGNEVFRLQLPKRFIFLPISDFTPTKGNC